ncbi:MAG: helix-turn-helix domain-containing protein [Solirubrobacterales bacterium]|nr:helix-turn-helix domain-containing protein [Solirubrobacterales bacterium]
MTGLQPEPLAQPTRARLFAAIRERADGASTEELANELGLHVNGVRRHLDLMLDADLLTRERRKHGRGRPRDIWSIAAGAVDADRSDEDYADVARWLARAIPTGRAGLRRVEETGREVGRELAADADAPLPDELGRLFTGLRFQPDVNVEGDRVSCTLCNCPYRESVRENPEAVCRLHRGITEGILEQLAPDARLVAFEPRDPDQAGCLVEVVEAG